MAAVLQPEACGIQSQHIFIDPIGSKGQASTKRQRLFDCLARRPIYDQEKLIFCRRWIVYSGIAALKQLP